MLKTQSKLVVTFALLAISPLVKAQTQTWEKLVTPGLTYRMEIDLGLPRVIHALRYTPGGPSVTSRPETAKDKIMIPEDKTKGRDTLTNTIISKNAIAGVNGDFFPFTGDPIGAMVRNQELLSSPFGTRSVFAWGPNYIYTGPMDFSARATYADGELNIDAVNELAKDNQVILQTPANGVALTEVTAVHAIIETDQTLPPNGSITGTVKIFVPDNTRVNLEPNQMVLSATGNKKALLAKIPRDSEITITIDSKQIDWSKALHAIGGGPGLIRDGKINIPLAAERFQSDFSTARHPRTAIGATAQGDIWLVVVDGRQPMSRGTSLNELAQIMQRMGCVQAMNLDGGGSSTLNILGLTVNRPSDGTERPISNSFLLFGELPTPDPDSNYVIKGLPRVTEGEVVNYSIIDAAGNVVPNRDVIWSAKGAAWIDQSGTLRAQGNGKSTISALIKGKIISVDITVQPKPKDPPKTNPKKA